MSNLPFKFGNQVYTWFMKDTGAFWDNKLDHMIEVTAKAGMTGIEPMHFWMGDLYDADKLKNSLEKHNVELTGIALVLDWNNPEETPEEMKAADEVIEILKQFPGSKLCTVQMPTGRHDLEQRRLNLVACVNAVSARAVAQGVECSFHPNSPETSTNRTAEDYEVIINGLDATVTGWTPDVGHIINGGMDPLETMKKWQHLINHVHYKDWDGQPEFALMGAGKVDFVAITQWLKDINYTGYITCEDEAEQAVEDPDGVTIHDGQWIQNDLIPALK